MLHFRRCFSVFRLVVVFLATPTFVRAGVISEAPSFSTLLLRTLTFLLSLVGIVAILALSVAAVFYFFSSGDAKAVQVAKKYTWATVIGLLVAFSALIVIRQLSKLLL